MKVNAGKHAAKAKQVIKHVSNQQANASKRANMKAIACKNATKTKHVIKHVSN